MFKSITELTFACRMKKGKIYFMSNRDEMLDPCPSDNNLGGPCINIEIHGWPCPQCPSDNSPEGPYINYIIHGWPLPPRN